MKITRSFTMGSLVVLLATACGGASRNEADSVATVGETPKGEATMKLDYMQMPLETITGDTTTLADFNGSALLLVNVASACGNTPQYEDLERLYRQYKDKGLVVVGFPADNFGGQEPGSNAEILTFCRTRFDVTFPMMAKISVKGDDKHPLFAALTEESSIPGEITWNFAKFLLDSNGRLVHRFSPRTRPMSDELVAKLRPLLEGGDT